MVNIDAAVVLDIVAIFAFLYFHVSIQRLAAAKLGAAESGCDRDVNIGQAKQQELTRLDKIHLKGTVGLKTM